MSDQPRHPRDLIRREPPRSGEVVARGAPRPRPRPQQDDGPSPDDLERFGDVTRTCPECGKDVFDDAAVCYHCGHAFERERAARRAPTVFFVVVVVLLIVAFLITR